MVVRLQSGLQMSNQLPCISDLGTRTNTDEHGLGFCLTVETCVSPRPSTLVCVLFVDARIATSHSIECNKACYLPVLWKALNRPASSKPLIAPNTTPRTTLSSTKERGEEKEKTPSSQAETRMAPT